MQPDMTIISRRLDTIQQELGVMRLRDESREASFQSITATLMRQMIDLSLEIDKKLTVFSDLNLTHLVDRVENLELRLEASLGEIKISLDQIISRLPKAQEEGK